MLEIQSHARLVSILECVDVIVDGRYDQSLQPKPFCGSSNQQIWKIVDGVPMLHELN